MIKYFVTLILSNFVFSQKPEEEEPVDLTLWGELEDEVYEEVMPGEDSDEEEEADVDKDKENEAGEEEEEDEAGDDDTAAGLKTPGEGYAHKYIFKFQTLVHQSIVDYLKAKR